MVARLRDEGRVVWYIRADNEVSGLLVTAYFANLQADPLTLRKRQGHGFVRKANTDFQFFAMVLFIRAVVG